MFEDIRFLVVDDEDAVCQSCRRILSAEGFPVETSSDAREGLRLAADKDFAAILLDIRMPQMDGIQFLKELRVTKPDVPVIVITAHPSVPNVASAMRLGAVDYIIKPFTPAQIRRAIRRLARPGGIPREADSGCASAGAQPTSPAAQELRYWDESWFQPVAGAAVRVGAVLTRPQCETPEEVCLPHVDWLVYQGLPLAGVTITGGSRLTVPSPVSGVVVARNRLLLERPLVLWDDPCGDGWIASINPVCLEDDARNCKLRRVVLANADETSACDQYTRLTSLGCRVRIAGVPGEVGPALRGDPDCNVLVIDSASLGEHGPALVARINGIAPSTKIVVVASADSKWESAYRAQRIFYYAVEPFSDNEIIDIMNAAFRREPLPAPQGERRRTPAETVSAICIANRDGTRVGLLAESGLLRRDDGLGWQVVHKLAMRHYSVETTAQRRGTISIAIRQVQRTCGRVLVLVARETGRLPGSLVREEAVPAASAADRKVTYLVVQPTSGGDPLGFDARTTAALAEHIVQEMVSC